MLQLASQTNNEDPFWLFTYFLVRDTRPISSLTFILLWFLNVQILDNLGRIIYLSDSIPGRGHRFHELQLGPHLLPEIKPRKRLAGDEASDERPSANR
jgi:hypothetical protein